MTDSNTIRPVPTRVATHELHTVRSRTNDALATAWQELVTWVDLVRQGAEARTGSVHPDAVVQDPAYDQALDLFSPLNRSITTFNRLAARIEAGEH